MSTADQLEEAVKLRNILLFGIYKLPSGVSRRALFMYYHRQFPHLRNPSTFNEKMNWRILYDRRPILEWTCDKLAMKEYASKVPGLRVPQTYWFGSNLSELSDVELPEDWVFKPNHRSGKVFFGHGRPDVANLERRSDDWLTRFEANDLHEWAYRKARPVLLIEEMIGAPGIPPTDYKFFVFDGEVALVQVDTDRYTGHRRRMYLPDWTPLEGHLGHYQLGPIEPSPPANFPEMLAIASELGRPFDFIRVDLYTVADEIFFGEVTPYNASGLTSFAPKSLDAYFGAKWELADRNRT
jgi:TupA-like ATPgrasp